MNYGEWLRVWFANYVEPTAKSKTRERYAEIIEKRLCPKIGDYGVESLTPLVLQTYVTELLRSGNLQTGKGLSANTVNGIVTVIQNSLKTAYISGVAKTYAADKIKRPKTAERTVTCFTLREQKRIERVALESDKPHLKGVVLCLYSGLRIGELLALTWDDVDFSRKTIDVNKTSHEAKDKNGRFCRIVEAPKTLSSKRIIPLPKKIFALLRGMKKQSKGEHVVCGKSGNPVSIRCYQSAFAALLKKANVERKGFHALRHTFATRALECNMDVKTLSEILGHKNSSITLNRYVHSLPEHKAEMMNKLGELL